MGIFYRQSSAAELTPHALLHHDVKWVVLHQEGLSKTEIILDALGVNWLVVPAGNHWLFIFMMVLFRCGILCVFMTFSLKI